MKNDHLKAIQAVAEADPKFLPHLLAIYSLGYMQGKIDMSIKVSNEYQGINYGSEVINAN